MPNVPTLKTARLTLRELVESDAPAYQRYFANYEVVRYLAAHVPWPYPQDGAINYIRDDVLPKQGKDRWVRAITLSERPQELIGALDLLRNANPFNRGFWLAQPFWGRGFMTEAVQAVNDYAFAELKFEKLIFGNAVQNRPSGRIKEKTGARLIRRDPGRYVDPSFTEQDVYEFTKDEWARGKSE